VALDENSGGQHKMAGFVGTHHARRVSDRGFAVGAVWLPATPTTSQEQQARHDPDHS
jgi:hypothetical protein